MKVAPFCIELLTYQLNVNSGFATDLLNFQIDRPIEGQHIEGVAKLTYNLGDRLFDHLFYAGDDFPRCSFLEDEFDPCLPDFGGVLRWHFDQKSTSLFTVRQYVDVKISNTGFG